MQYDSEIADPVAEVRDVVESYRCCGVTPADWHEALGGAIAVLDKLPEEAATDTSLSNLVPLLRILQTEGLDSAPNIVEQVADKVAEVLSRARIPGIPRPDEEEWGFEEANSS